MPCLVTLSKAVCLQLAVLFYLFLFRKTMYGVYAELGMARAFVFMMPLHVLSRPEIELVKEHFCASDGPSEHPTQTNTAQ
eukprot:227093-Rhodomonas_salina.5